MTMQSLIEFTMSRTCLSTMSSLKTEKKIYIFQLSKILHHQLLKKYVWLRRVMITGTSNASCLK